MTSVFSNVTQVGRTVLAALVCAIPVTAQSFSGSGVFAPGMGRSTIGLQIGSANWQLGCSAPGTCGESDRLLNLYTRGQFASHVGVQAGLFDMGDVTRGVADARARGLNLSLVGRVPLGAKFSGWGRIGTTYGQAGPTPGLAAGQLGTAESGFGLSYGLGLSWDFSARLSAVVEWDSHDFRFVGSGRDTVRATSLGLQYRY